MTFNCRCSSYSASVVVTFQFTGPSTYDDNSCPAVLVQSSRTQGRVGTTISSRFRLCHLMSCRDRKFPVAAAPTPSLRTNQSPASPLPCAHITNRNCVLLGQHIQTESRVHTFPVLINSKVIGMETSQSNSCYTPISILCISQFSGIN